MMAYPPDSKVHFINSKKRSSAIHLAMNELHVRSADGTCCEVAVELEVEEVLARFANSLASARHRAPVLTVCCSQAHMTTCRKDSACPWRHQEREQVDP